MAEKRLCKPQITRVKPKSMRSARAPLRKLLGELPLLPGEDRAALEELYDSFDEEIKPANVIEQVFINEVVYSEWDVSR